MLVRYCFGMIWSVSTLTRGSGAAIPVWVVNGSKGIVTTFAAFAGSTGADGGEFCYGRREE